MIVIGIDPGLDGAMAVIGAIGDVQVFDTPTLVIVSKNGNRREYDLGLMAQRLMVYSDLTVQVFLEQVHAMPGQGVRSMFTMGYGSGAWEGLLAMAGFPVTRVAPQRWKKALLADMGKDKDASRFRAMQLFPAVATQLQRKKDDGRAEALLIAEYGRRLNG